MCRPHRTGFAPRAWNDWTNQIAQWGLGVLWGLGGLVLLAFVLLMATGWIVRFINWKWPTRPRPRLVPRVHLSPLTGSSGGADGDSLTPLLRSQILRVQTSNRLNLQFVTGATNVQGLVTAVKDIDSKLGAWAQLALALNWLWHRKTLIVQGQVLPSGRDGVGITLSIGTGARGQWPWFCGAWFVRIAMKDLCLSGHGSSLNGPGHTGSLRGKNVKRLSTRGPSSGGRLVLKRLTFFPLREPVG